MWEIYLQQIREEKELYDEGKTDEEYAGEISDLMQEIVEVIWFLIFQYIQMMITLFSILYRKNIGDLMWTLFWKKCITSKVYRSQWNMLMNGKNKTQIMQKIKSGNI